MLIAGALDALTFDDAGVLIERVRMATDAARAVEIPAAAWHSYVCLEPGTVVLEVKRGPYVPTAASDFAAWAPHDDPDAVAEYLAWMRTAPPRA